MNIEIKNYDRKNKKTVFNRAYATFNIPDELINKLNWDRQFDNDGLDDCELYTLTINSTPIIFSRYLKRKELGWFLYIDESVKNKANIINLCLDFF